MAAVLAKLVKELRDKTGAGMLDCKSIRSNRRNVEEAITWLREKALLVLRRKLDVLLLKD